MMSEECDELCKNLDVKCVEGNHVMSTSQSFKDYFNYEQLCKNLGNPNCEYFQEIIDIVKNRKLDIARDLRKSVERMNEKMWESVIENMKGCYDE